MTRIPFIDLLKQYRLTSREVKRAVESVFATQQFVLGGIGAGFEQNMAKKIGSEYGVGLASGSDALYLALQAIGVGPGDEVITTPFSFFATAGCISRSGARPVFSDSDPQTFNLDPAQIAKKITKRTKAIIPVHLFGLSCDMKAIQKIAKAHKLFVIEDAAQAFGAKYWGESVGALGDMGCFSFYPTKNLGGAGDGGLLTTSSVKWAEKIKLLRDHGAKTKYIHDFVGINSRLDEIQAAVLSVKLKYIDTWNKKRADLAKLYDRGLAGLPLKTPHVPRGYSHVYHLYSILADSRDELLQFLRKNGVGCGVYYPLALHLQPCYKKLGYRIGDFPVSEQTSKRILALPMFPELTAQEVKRVVAIIKAFYRGKA